MQKTERVYVMTVHPSSRGILRLWTGTSLHALRHCSIKQNNPTLVEMQHMMDELYQRMRPPTDGASYSINRSRLGGL
jgi:hypothetical protein